MKIRSAAKETVYGLAHHLGLTAIVPRFRRGTLTVLTYHSFGDSHEYPYLERMPKSEIGRQLDYLADRYEVVELRKGINALSQTQKGSCTRPMVTITVDDGFADSYQYLFPELVKRSLPATIYVATDFLDTGRLPWPTRLCALLHNTTHRHLSRPCSLSLEGVGASRRALLLLFDHLSRMDSEHREAVITEIQRDLGVHSVNSIPALNWDQVREMQRSGITFGSHTHFHSWLDRVSADEVERELTVSKRRVEEETGRACETLAYPNGNWSNGVAEAAGKTGYRYALTQRRGSINQDTLQRLAIARVNVPPDERVGTFACRAAGIAI